jgi:hypothetical protein
VAPPGSVVWRTAILRRAFDSETDGIWHAFAEDYELLLRGSLVTSIGTTAEAPISTPRSVKP